MNSKLFLALIAVSVLAAADPSPIGYLQLPRAERRNVERLGGPTPVVVGGKQGEIWYDQESYSLQVRKFDVFAEPRVSSEQIASLDISGAWMDLLAGSATGEFRGTLTETKKYEDGKHQLLVFDNRDGWVQVRFRNHLPWNGRFGWVELSNVTGGFVSY